MRTPILSLIYKKKNIHLIKKAVTALPKILLTNNQWSGGDIYYSFIAIETSLDIALLWNHKTLFKFWRNTLLFIYTIQKGFKVKCLLR